MQVKNSADWRRGPKPIALSLRFATKVDRDGPLPEWHPEYGNCHVWTASVGSNGYGQIGRSGAGTGAMGAHLAAWQLASGVPVPDSMMVGHTCDRKLCVRNDEYGVYLVNGQEFPRYGHLWLGTLADNNADMYAKGRYAWQADPERFRQRLSKPRSHGYNRGETSANAKLTDDAVREILRRFAAGETNKAALSREFGVTDALIGRVIRRDIWSHVVFP